MRHRSLLLLSALLLTCFTGCYRSRCEVWEDTKTCSRYVGKGVRSLFGKHGGAYRQEREYGWEEDALAIAEDESYDSSKMQGWGGNKDNWNSAQWDEAYAALPTFSRQDAYPLAKASPGDPGSLIPGIEAFCEPVGKHAALFSPIHFDTDKYDVVGQDNLQKIESIAKQLAHSPSLYLFIEGHADERGSAAYNLALGSRRANSVRATLIQNGVSPDQIFTVSYGKEKPSTAGQGETAWRQNRRAQFKLYEKNR